MSPSNRDSGATTTPGTRTIGRVAADHVPDHAHQLDEGRALRADRVGHAVAPLGTLGHAQLGQVVDVDGPDAVVAPAPHREGGQVSEEPGDVVDEHPVATEQDGGSENGERQPGLGQRPFDERLAPEVGVGRLDARMGDAHVDDPLDPGPLGRLEEGARVHDGQVVIDLSAGEAHPVRVVEGGGAPERLDQGELVVEVEGTYCFDGVVTGGPVRMPGDGPHPATPFGECTGDGRSGVAERTGHDVEPGVPPERGLVGTGRAGRHGFASGARGPARPSNSAANRWAWAKRSRAGCLFPSRWLSISRPRYSATMA